MTRPETGRMKFKDDWTGVFIRGDAAFEYAHQLRLLLESLKPPERPTLISLLQLLESSEEPTTKPVQQMKPFSECNTA